MNEKNVLRGREPLVPIPQENLGNVLLKIMVSQNKDDIAFINEKSGEVLTYGNLVDKSCKLAITLRNYGVNQNKLIALASDNHVNNFIVVLAALYIGVPLVLVNPKYTEHELQHALTLTKPYIIFCRSTYLQKFADVKSKNSFIQDIVSIDSNNCTKNYIGCVSLEEFINQYSSQFQDSASFTPIKVEVKNHLAFILFSSGTTGLPKGVMLTHLNIFGALVYQLETPAPTNNEPALAMLPVFHTYGLHAVLGGLLLGRKHVILEQFEPVSYLEAIEKYRIPVLATVPPLVQFLLKSEIVDRYDLSCVKEVICGAAPLSRDLEEAIKKKFNLKMVRQGFGMTELGLAFATPPDKERMGSVGRLTPAVSCVIRDVDTGENLGPNKSGEICIKGATVMKGYYGNEGATKDAFTKDGWMKTGDIGYYDKAGYFYVVDRLKEIIKYKGFQVAPAELEQILVTNPKIQDAGVIGVPDDKAGELPLAFVVKQPGVNLTESEVQQYLAKFVSANKHLRGGVIFIDVIPRNPSGKIIRKDLKKLLTKLKSKL